MPDKAQGLYNAFRKWAIERYGRWAVFSQAKFSFNEYQKSLEYQIWLNEGRVGWSTPSLPEQAKEKAEVAKRAEEEKLPPRLGEKKWIGENYYEFRDGKWRVTTPPEGGTPEIPTPTIVPTTQKGYPAEVVSEGGYSFQIFRDANGNVVGKELIGETPRPFTRDWTSETLAESRRASEAGLALEKEKFAWTREQAARAQDPELQRAINELRWEKDRVQLLSGLPSDDWISRYILENQPNPYKQSADTSKQSVGDVLDFQTGNVQYQQQRLAEAIASGAPAETITEFQGYVTEAQKQRDTTYGAWKGIKEEKTNWTPQPYPNAPEWLPPYAPGQVAGRMITPQNVPTPSGQQLTQMDKSRASQLGYFADWTARMGGGRNWRDILGEAELMQPLTPRGAGGFRTSPARQWV